MIRHITLIALILFSHTAYAVTYQAIQGDVLSIEYETDDPSIRLFCLGKQWPVKRVSPTLVRGWIGIDLKTKSKKHPIKWTTKEGNFTDILHVSKGDFRISHITVKKNMSSFDPPTLKRVLADQKSLKNTYTMPVDATPDIHMSYMPIKGITSSPFGAQRYVNGAARSPHSGIDIAAPSGTPILAPLAGKVLLVADMYLNGKLIAVGHGFGLVSVYAHMKQIDVKQEQWVQVGDILGQVGSTGRSTGPHLHWGVRFNGARINPQAMIDIK